jgi:predicted  nucleic acid-binding Zn-ribbon protein
MKKIFTAIGFVFLSLVILILPAAAQPEAAKTDQQILREILAELKQLRSTLARTTVNQLRFQTAFDQYKVQQTRVDSLSRELDSIKNQLNAMNPVRALNEEQIKRSEEMMAQTTDPRQRQNLERQIQSARRNIEMQEQRDKRMKERQYALEMQIPGEQAKLDQLNFELERIKQDINSLLNQ